METFVSDLFTGTNTRMLYEENAQKMTREDDEMLRYQASTRICVVANSLVPTRSCSDSK